MWIMTNSSFVSIVEHWEKPGTLIVRGRFSGDVGRFLQTKKRETVTKDRDYRYRMEADREAVDKAVVRAARGIDYGNFKNSCPEWRHVVYMRVWSVLHEAQHLAATGASGWWKRLAVWRDV